MDLLRKYIELMLLEAISDEERERISGLQKNDLITVYHGTPLFRLPNLINGFDATQPHRRDYRAGAHKGLFVTSDWDVAKGFGGGAIIEIVVPAKFVHGTNYGGNTGREQEKLGYDHNWIRQKHPKSFRPYMAYTMLQGSEPQGLLIGVVSPKQIKRIWIKKGENWEEYSREEYLKMEDIYNVEHGHEKRFKDSKIDLSNPRIDLDDFLNAYLEAHDVNKDIESLKKTLIRYQKSDRLPELLGNMEIGGSYLGALASQSIEQQVAEIT